MRPRTGHTNGAPCTSAWIVLAALAALALLVPATARAAAGPSLAVDATSSDHQAISPDIYGMNFVAKPTASAISLSVDRWGGNATDTYNYKLGSSNSGADWYFENTPGCWSAQ